MKKNVLVIFAVIAFGFSYAPNKDKEKMHCISAKSEKKELKSISPSKVKTVKNLSDVEMLAAYINTECENCLYEEKRALMYILHKRAMYNFNDYGQSLFEQLSAKRQFAVINGRRVSKKFFINIDRPDHLENIQAAEDIIEGYVPDYIPADSWYFMMPHAAPVTKQNREKSKKTIPSNFKHLIF